MLFRLNGFTWSQTKSHPNRMIYHAHQLFTSASTQLCARRHFIQFYPFWQKSGSVMNQERSSSLIGMLAFVSCIPLFSFLVWRPQIFARPVVSLEIRALETPVEKGRLLRPYLIGDVHHQIVFTLVSIAVLGRRGKDGCFISCPRPLCCIQTTLITREKTNTDQYINISGCSLLPSTGCLPSNI